MSAGRRLVAGTRGRTLAVSILAIIALAGLFIARDSGAYEAYAFVLFGVFLLVFTYPAHLVIERTLGIDPEVVEAQKQAAKEAKRKAKEEEKSGIGQAKPGDEEGEDSPNTERAKDKRTAGAEVDAALYYNQCIVVIGADAEHIAPHLRLPLALFLYGAFLEIECHHEQTAHRLLPMLSNFVGGPLEAIGCDLGQPLHQEVMRAGGLAWRAGSDDFGLIRSSLTPLLESWPVDGQERVGDEEEEQEEPEVLVSAVWIYLERASAGDTTRDADIELFKVTPEEWEEDPGIGGWASFPGATYALEKLVERLCRPESDDFNGLRIGIDCAVLGDESEDANVDGSLDLCRKAMVGDCLVSHRFQEAIGDLALFDDLGYMVVDDTRELRPVYRLRPKFMAARNTEFDPTLTGG